MERRKALIAAATSTLIVANGTIAGAFFGDGGLLGFGQSVGRRGLAIGSSASPTSEVTDRYVVNVPLVTPPDDSGAPPPSPRSPVGGADEGPAVVQGAPATAEAAALPAPPASMPSAVDPQPPSTTAPEPPVTGPAGSSPSPSPSPPSSTNTTTTTTTAEMPEEWQVSQPPPPMPPDCQEPHLEDDGVWNCQH